MAHALGERGALLGELAHTRASQGSGAGETEGRASRSVATSWPEVVAPVRPVPESRPASMEQPQSVVEPAPPPACAATPPSQISPGRPPPACDPHQDAARAAIVVAVAAAASDAARDAVAAAFAELTPVLLAAISRVAVPLAEHHSPQSELATRARNRSSPQTSEGRLLEICEEDTLTLPLHRQVSNTSPRSPQQSEGVDSAAFGSLRGGLFPSEVVSPGAAGRPA